MLEQALNLTVARFSSVVRHSAWKQRLASNRARRMLPHPGLREKLMLAFLL